MLLYMNSEIWTLLVFLNEALIFNTFLLLFFNGSVKILFFGGGHYYRYSGTSETLVTNGSSALGERVRDV